MKILPDPADRLAVDVAHGRGTLHHEDREPGENKAPACLSPYRLAFSRAELLREMVAASVNPDNGWHYCHADNVAALAEAERELSAVIAGHRAEGKTLCPSTLEWV